MDVISKMDMNHSYKPVLIKAILSECDSKGRVSIERIIDYYIEFYASRQRAGLPAEKSDGIFAKGTYDRKSVQMLILQYPFKTFEDRQVLNHAKTLGIIEVEPTVWKHLTADEKAKILQICDEKLDAYYKHLSQI